MCIMFAVLNIYCLCIYVISNFALLRGAIDGASDGDDDGGVDGDDVVGDMLGRADGIWVGDVVLIAKY